MSFIIFAWRDYDMTPNQFKHYRKKLGLSQSQAAKALGVKTGTVKSWEAGRRRVPEVAVKLLECLEAADKIGKEGKP